ncbi:MAG TPA: GTPase, partial [Tepidisphaeraceae bacterium]|nr:GTPase [Tepidisphaeraceae bacterium]
MLLTPASAGAIAVVRLLGAGVGEFLRAHFSAAPLPGRCVHGKLRDGMREIDDPVVVFLPDGSGADISLHGGSWVVQSVLELAARAGFQIISTAAQAEALDFLDGSTCIDREIHVALGAARTELGIRLLSAQARAWEQFIASSPSSDDIREVLSDESLVHLLNPPAVAVIGAANVGKSTLANQLFAQERSITADVAGTTRDWVGEIANIDGLPVMLIDTPGQRQTADEIEQAAIAQSRSMVERASLILLVLDATRPLEPEQSPLVEAHPNAMRVINKCDRPWAWDCDAHSGIRTVATTGVGVDLLRRAVAAHFRCADLDLARPRWWTQRQRKLLESAMSEASEVKQIL